MILDAILGSLILAIGAVVQALLPGTDPAADVAPLLNASDIQSLFTLGEVFDAGLPIHEGYALLAAYIGLALVVDGYIVARAAARWLPSWLTGGG